MPLMQVRFLSGAFCMLVNCLQGYDLEIRVGRDPVIDLVIHDNRLE